MSGSATFFGTNYQSHVIAHVYVHILAQAPLGWLTPADDTPVGVSGETGGPGDDAEIEFGDRHSAVEIQAKHGLTAGAKLTEAVCAIRDRSDGMNAMEVILVVDRGSSRTVHLELAKDLERLRSGRRDHLKAEAKRLIEDLGEDWNVLNSLYIVPVDLDHEHDPERKVTFQFLGSVLEDTCQTRAAWAVLVQDANDLCAKRLRRTRKELVDLLTGAQIKVRPPTKDERFMRHLDLTKKLLASGQSEAVLKILEALEGDLKDLTVDPRVRYRLAQHRAAALANLDRPEEALNAARRALDIDSSGIHALLIAAQASVQAGDLQSAIQYIDQAIKIEGGNPDTWATKVQISALAGEPLPLPPKSVVESDSYQLALAQIAVNAGDWPRVLEVTDGLLTRSVRSPKMLTLRIAALLAVADDKDPASARATRLDAERLATEAIAALDSEDLMMTKLLVQRAEARHELGKVDESSSDLETACRLDDENPEAIGRLAQVHMSAGRAKDALQVLANRIVDEYPMLLALRARALIASGDAEKARHDLDNALNRLDDAPEPDALRLHAAEIALMLGDLVFAERILESITTDAHSPEILATLRGRAAFERGDTESGVQWFRKAAEHAPQLRSKLFAELAGRLLRLRQPREAVQVFEEIGFSELPEPSQSEYVSALMEVNELTRAAKIVNDIAATGSLPDWALGIQSDVALRQGDTQRAVATLQILAKRHPDDRRVAFELARRFVAMNEAATAQPYLDLLLSDETLSAAEGMNAAHLLKEAGRVDEAVTLAFKAFRAAPQDPAMHRGFASLLMTDRRLVPPPEMVAAETYIKLKADDGLEREYVIYSDGPIDALRKELRVDEAGKADYLGKRLGETVVTNAGTFQEKHWRVVEILPAIVYIFRDVVSHYEERFPGEPFFISMFKVPEEDSVRMFAPLIATLHSRRARAEEVFRLYRENIFPLGFVARMLEVSIADVMAGATATGQSLGPLSAEWFDAEGQEESRDAARHATEVVITRSALETLLSLGLLDALGSAYVWVAPQSLLNVLKQELREAEDKVAEGHRTITSGDTGLRLEELEAGHPLLLERENGLRAILNWVVKNARVEIRPLDTIPPPSSREEEARNALGNDSYDSIRLAEHIGGAMFADDLGLRKFLPKGSRARSFSVVALLSTLSERGIISADKRDEFLLQLVDRNYVLVVPTRALLVAAIRRSNGTQPDVARAFALLAGPPLALPDAARIAVEVLRAQLVAPVQVIDVATLARLALEAMAKRWSPGLCAYALTKAAAAELTFLPQHFKTVRDVAAAFVRQHG